MTETTHAHHASAPDLTAALFAVGVMAVVYVVVALRQRRSSTWSGWRIAAWVTGCLLIALALVPAVLPFPTGDFREHMLQHLLLGMLAPLGLVLAAPVTLTLRSAPRGAARLLVRVLQSGYVRLVARPVVALALNVGGMAALYFTPLYQWMGMSAALHWFVHAHFLLAGCLFAWVIAGPDPAPRRPSVPFRLVILGVAVAVHATLAQLLYAGAFVAVDVPVAEREGAAELMYYGGDIAELLLAFALVSTWRPARNAARHPARALRPRPGIKLRLQS